MSEQPNILVIYTGGTIGMKPHEGSDLLHPTLIDPLQDFSFLLDLNARIVVESLPKIKDSSDISANDWLQLSQLILSKKNEFDAFVVLHGTDTMSYAGAAQSYLLQSLHKAVIFTGAQIPMSAADSDGEDNFTGAVEFAIAFSNQALKNTVVGIYFDGRLLQANRTVKYSNLDLSAFQSPNFEELGIRSNGIQLFDNHNFNSREIIEIEGFSEDVLLLKIHPNFPEKHWIKLIENSKPSGILLETYGSGNISHSEALLNCLKEVISKNCLVLNVSQCLHGVVDMSVYDTGNQLQKIGVVSGKDMTTEAGLVKLLFCATMLDKSIAKRLLASSIAGEMTI